MARVTGLTQKVFTGSYVAAGSGTAANDFNVEGTLSKFPFNGDITLQLVAARTGGASTLDVVLLCSLDGGTTYSTLVTFTQITGASGAEIKQLNFPMGAKIKTDINVGSASTFTVTVYVCGPALGGAGK